MDMQSIFKDERRVAGHFLGRPAGIWTKLALKALRPLESALHFPRDRAF
jgi:hypothetical protein